MSHLPRPVFRLIVVLSVLLVVGFAAFGVARAATSSRILDDVTVAGIPLGGLTPDEATAALASRAGELAARPATFRVGNTELILRPDEIGFAVDVQETVAAAFDIGRSGSLPGQFWWWLTHALGSVDMEPVTRLDAAATEALLVAWEGAAIPDLPFEGAIETDGTTPVALEPRPGRLIDRATAPAALVDGILSGEVTALSVVAVDPTVTAAALDAALTEARRWLSGDVTLTTGTTEIVLTPSDLASALRSQPTGAGGLRLLFDPGTVRSILEPSTEQIETSPVDARFAIDGYQVSVVAGSTGTVVDEEASAGALAEAAASSWRRGALAIREGAQPEVTTAELESLDITHLVSRFTTYHDCCQNRVSNIHLMADAVDGAIVRPGERFSLNDYVGRRTPADGYLEDGTIIGGELTTSVGGGVSQFATTFYNTVYWGGYQDVSHKPHSFYFSRYPEGIEATISWPAPDIVFGNDSKSGILVKTEYTDTSITVSLYGNNDGRTVSGRHRNGRTEMTVIENGGSDARVVTSEVSDRRNPTTPGTELRPNPAIPPGERRQVQKPSPGWSVKVTRTITTNGDSRQDTWTVTYSPRREILEVNPCEILELATPCPTTTTTAPPSTTTTTTTTAPPPA